MRNLQIYHRSILSKDIISRLSTAYCVGERALFVATKEGGVVRFHEEDGEPKKTCGIEIRPQGFEDVSQLQYCAATGIFFILKEGKFWQSRNLINSDNEELFTSGDEIVKFAVSPDCRLLAVLMKKSLILLRLPDLECLIMHSLKKQDENYGSSVVWRSDSKYFAVNITEIPGRREIRVYDEEGALYSTSQFHEFEILNQVLAWQPSGGLIASYGKSPHGTGIVFSELNGLKRSHLPLFTTKEINGVAWNAASDILAVQYQSEVQLWTRSNYVWMLKKVLRLQCKSALQNVRLFSWDLECPYRIHVLYELNYAQYDLTYLYTTALSGGSGIVASWSGFSVFFTLLRDNCAPPPNGCIETTLDSIIVEVIISDFWDGCICITINREINLFRRKELAMELMSKFVLPEEFSLYDVSSWTWPSFSYLCCTYHGSLVTFHLEQQSNLSAKPSNMLDKYEHLAITENVEEWLRVQTIGSKTTESSEVFVINGVTLERVNLECKSKTAWLDLPNMFPIVSHINVNDLSVVILHDQVSRKLFILSDKCSAGILKISEECTSFTTFVDNLLVTTLSGSLKIFDCECLQQMLHQGLTVEQIISSERIFVRKIEKGSILMSCYINALLEPSLTMQIIPRGNFETICPRPLLISIIRSSLMNYTDKNPNRYALIMTALRRHRLDYKVLIDEMRLMEKINPTCTLQKNLRTLVEQVQDSHSLVLLVTDLDEEYRECIKMIKNILDDCLNQTSRKPNMEEAYLAACAKLGMFEEALLSRFILGEHKNNRGLVAQRVKFLSYYCDNPATLFDASLGTYDLSLSSLVADCLGKDPKEFVPILDELNALNEVKRKFKVDDKLRRYSKAVLHLIEDIGLQDVDILKYVERHRLFSDVIQHLEKMLARHHSVQNYPHNRKPYDLMTLLRKTKVSYGKYLEEHGKLREAFLMYRSGNEFDRATECAINGGEWESAIATFTTCHTEQDELIALCNRILKVLEDRMDFSGAARLCETYLKNFDKAIDYWIKDRKWLTARALCIVVVKVTDNSVQENILSKLKEAYIERKKQIVMINRDVTAHFSRWRVVKAEKSIRELQSRMGNDDFCDVKSVSSYSTNTGSSCSTGKTYRSGKSKRKLERKLYSLKEGSPYEDIAITVHLWQVFDKIQREVQCDTENLIKSLWDFEENVMAEELGKLFENLKLECGKALQEIWPSVLLDDLLETKYRIPPASWSTSWEKLCLHTPSSKAVKN